MRLGLPILCPTAASSGSLRLTELQALGLTLPLTLPKVGFLAYKALSPPKVMHATLLSFTQTITKASPKARDPSPQPPHGLRVDPRAAQKSQPASLGGFFYSLK